MLRFLGSDWRARAAHVILLAWAGFWTWFGLASGIGEGLDAMGILLHTALPGLLFVVITLLVWRWERVGGPALVVVGLALALIYPLRIGGWRTFDPFILATMILPPVAAGLLLWRHTRTTPAM